MARYTDANCRLCRREGQKLFLKGEQMLQHEVRNGKKKLRSRTTWTEQKKDFPNMDFS